VQGARLAARRDRRWICVTEVALIGLGPAGFAGVAVVGLLAKGPHRADRPQSPRARGHGGGAGAVRAQPVIGVGSGWSSAVLVSAVSGLPARDGARPGSTGCRPFKVRVDALRGPAELTGRESRSRRRGARSSSPPRLRGAGASSTAWGWGRAAGPGGSRGRMAGSGLGGPWRCAAPRRRRPERRFEAVRRRRGLLRWGAPVRPPLGGRTRQTGRVIKPVRAPKAQGGLSASCRAICRGSCRS